MTKDIKRRKTPLEERIRIMDYCISHSNDYASTVKEFNCSYGQVYSWVKKYVRGGVEGLRHGRGRNISEKELSAVERLKAENGKRLVNSVPLFVWTHSMGKGNAFTR